jgi:hypothetical protein
MSAGAPEGNDNATRGMEWRQAIKRALAHKSGKTFREGLDQVAKQLVDAACAGDQWAIREIGDRSDGKPAQEVSGPGGGAIPVEARVTFVSTASPA